MPAQTVVTAKPWPVAWEGGDGSPMGSSAPAALVVLVQDMDRAGKLYFNARMEVREVGRQRRSVEVDIIMEPLDYLKR